MSGISRRLQTLMEEVAVEQFEGESLEAVQSIVEAGGDVNYISGRLLFKGIVKMTPLARARELGNKPIAAYLESKGGKDESADKPMAKS